VGRLVKNRDNPRAWELARHQLLQCEEQVRRLVNARRGWDDHWRRYLEDHPESAYARLPHALEARPASDVHQISAASGRRIGMIYADGNNVGRLMATLATPQDYASVSAILSDATHKAVFDGLARHLQPQRARREETWLEAPDGFVHPFEILTIGGDDLLLLVPGSCALDIALTIAQSFERRIVDAFDVLKGELKELSLPPCTSIDTRSRYQLDRVVQLDQRDQLAELRTLKPLLGLSAGVVVAQEDAPIFFLRNLVDDLLKSAKKKASEQAKAGYCGGAVDFMVMKSITMVTDTIGEFRKQALEHDSDDELRRLYARPYAWHELAGLLGTVRVLRQVRLPRSQLYHLGETLEAALHRGLNASMLEYLFARTRMRREHSDALALHVERAWHAPEETAMRLPPWMERTVEVKDGPRRCRETIWLDMLEIYDLLEADKEPADGQD
jgi:CRISPR-associated protein Cmr2